MRWPQTDLTHVRNFHGCVKPFNWSVVFLRDEIEIHTVSSHLYDEDSLNTLILAITQYKTVYWIMYIYIYIYDGVHWKIYEEFYAKKSKTFSVNTGSKYCSTGGWLLELLLKAWAIMINRYVSDIGYHVKTSETIIGSKERGILLFTFYYSTRRKSWLSCNASYITELVQWRKGRVVDVLEDKKLFLSTQHICRCAIHIAKLSCICFMVLVFLIHTKYLSWQ